MYARTKLEAEERLKELADQLDIRLLIGRVFGLIAPRQPSHYVLPGLIRRVQTGALANIPGLEYCRDYLDLRDVCDALARLCTMAASLTVHQSVAKYLFGKRSLDPASGRRNHRRHETERKTGDAVQPIRRARPP